MKAVIRRADVAWWIMQQRQWSKWSAIAWSIREAHPRCAARNCFSGVIFGLPFLGQTWKKASWGSARRSRAALRAFDAQYLAGQHPPNEKISPSMKPRQSYTVQLRRLPEC